MQSSNDRNVQTLISRLDANCRSSGGDEAQTEKGRRPERTYKGKRSETSAALGQRTNKIILPLLLERGEGRGEESKDFPPLIDVDER